MAENRLNEPVFLTLSGDSIGALDVQHLTYFSIRDKLDDLLRVLEVEDPESAIIFCNTKDETSAWPRARQAGLQRGMAQCRFGAIRPRKGHGGHAQEQSQVLGLHGRGFTRIDISHLTHVINFDFRSRRRLTCIELVGPAARDEQGRRYR